MRGPSLNLGAPLGVLVATIGEIVGMSLTGGAPGVSAWPWILAVNTVVLSVGLLALGVLRAGWRAFGRPTLPGALWAVGVGLGLLATFVLRETLALLDAWILISPALLLVALVVASLGRPLRRWTVLVPAAALGVALLVPAPAVVWLHGWQSGAWAQATAKNAPTGGGGGPRQAQAAHGPALARHLVILSVDTLRARNMGTYGYGRDTDPHIKAFFAGGARFEQAYTTAPHSIPAVASLLTGRYPQHLPWRLGRRPTPEPAQTETIAEVLGARGFETTLALYTRYFAHPGVLQGFDTVLENPVPRDADPPPWKRLRDGPMAERVAEFIAARPRPGGRQLLWAHFMAPHEPYLPHPDLPELGRGRQGRYNQEIRYVDRGLGQVFEALERAGWLEHSLVILVADHGEAFGEHGRHYHGKTLFQEEIRIPMLMRWPGSAPRVVRAPVSLVDVMPTVLDALGIEHRSAFDGVSLGSVLRGGPAPTRAGVLVTRFKVSRMRAQELAWIAPDGKWLFTPGLQPLLRFDLERDRREEKGASFEGGPAAAVRAALGGR